MRAVLALVLVGGCAFRPGTAASGGDGLPAGGDSGSADAAVQPTDARGIDARALDARPIDAPRCAAGYAPIAGGPPTSSYKIFNWSATASSQSQAWSTAVATCSGDGAHLAFPDNASEMAALIGAIAVDPNGPYFWVGLTDSATEGAWLTVSGTAPPYLVWDSGQPNGGSAQNCAAGYDTNSDMFDYTCTTAYPFACECE